MFALLTVTFSALKGTALAVAIVNAAVLAAVLICLFLTGRKRETEPPKRTYFDPAPAVKPEPVQESEAESAEAPAAGPEAAQEPKAGPEAGGQESES